MKERHLESSSREEVLRLIRDMREEKGYSPAKIAAELNRRESLNANGSKWQEEDVRSILGSGTYLAETLRSPTFWYRFFGTILAFMFLIFLGVLYFLPTILRILKRILQ